MSSQPKEYLVFVGARIPVEDYVRIRKFCRSSQTSVADCVRGCIRKTMSNTLLDESDNAEIDAVRCHNHEARKRYSRKKNGSP